MTRHFPSDSNVKSFLHIGAESFHIESQVRRLWKDLPASPSGPLDCVFPVSCFCPSALALRHWGLCGLLLAAIAIINTWTPIIQSGHVLQTGHAYFPGGNETVVDRGRQSKTYCLGKDESIRDPQEHCHFSNLLEGSKDSVHITHSYDFISNTKQNQ